VSKSGYRFDDFKPYLYMTDDFGATWKSIAGNLPNEPINVIWEDTKNPNLLFVGNDGGAFVSIDRGASWGEDEQQHAQHLCEGISRFTRGNRTWFLARTRAESGSPTSRHSRS
jgi:photosystem II stability/assembly factor-like uncharacterized protein